MSLREEMEGRRDFTFTDDQWEIISADQPGPSLVVAGAGSGKTTVLAARIEHLVLSGAVTPDQVLGLTFTNKAAGELGTAVRTALLRAGGAPSGEVTMSTYHSFGKSLVADHGLRIGVEPSPRLVTDAARVQLARRVLREWPSGRGAAFGGRLVDLADEAAQLEAALSDHLCPPEHLQAVEEKWMARLEAALATSSTRTLDDQLELFLRHARRRHELAEVATETRRHKTQLGLADFGDLTRHAAELATVAEVRSELRERYPFVVLDEYQDTSVAQAGFLSRLFGDGHQVLAVGDPMQAIYGWRGASSDNLGRFAEQFAGQRPAPWSLAVSNRCPPSVLTAANHLTSGLREVSLVPVAELSPSAQHPRPGRVELSRHETAVAEAEWIAEHLEREGRERGSWGTCAVLSRTRAGLDLVHAALVSRNIPVEVAGLGGLLAVPVVAEVIAHVRCAVDASDNVSLARLLAGPRWRLGATDLAVLGARAAHLAGHSGSALDASVEERLLEAVDGADPTDLPCLAEAVADPGAMLSIDGHRRLTALSSLLGHLRSQVGGALVDLISEVIRASGLGAEVAAMTPEQQGASRQALEDLTDVVSAWSDLEGQSSARAFLDWVDHAEEFERGLHTSPPPGGDCIQLATIHAAKGLEWDVVAVPWLADKVFPSGTDRSVWLSNAEALPPGARGDDIPDGPLELTSKGIKDYRALMTERLQQEDRRLAYVAVTRAREVLLLSSHAWGPSQKQERKLSAFLLEISEAIGTGEPWHVVASGEANPALGTITPIPWRPQRTLAALRAAQVVAAVGPGPDPLDHAALLADLDRDVELLLAEERTRRRPSRAVMLPATLTASQLVALHRDEAAFARSLARPLPRRPAPAARRGTRLHLAVERWFGQQALIDLDEVPGRAYDDARDLDTVDADTIESMLARLPERYQIKPEAIEEPFAIVLDGRLVRGRIDAVYARGKEAYEVVDWKTGRSAADPVQLAVYRLAVARSRGVEPAQVSAAFVYLDRGDVVAVPDLPDEDQLVRLLRG